MEELVRWLIESAPSIAAGIMAVAVLRTVIGFPAALSSKAAARRSEALSRSVEAWKKENTRVSDDETLSDEERLRHAQAAFANMPRMGRAGLLHAAGMLAFIVVTIWLFVAVWTVTATLPGMWGESMWWVGLLLAGLQAAFGLRAVGKLEMVSPKLKTAVSIVAAVVHVSFAILYMLAALGCVFYAAVVWVLASGTKWIVQRDSPGGSPNVASLFVGF